MGKRWWKCYLVIPFYPMKPHCDFYCQNPYHMFRSMWFQSILHADSFWVCKKMVNSPHPNKVRVIMQVNHRVNNILTLMLRQFYQGPLMWRGGLTSSWHSACASYHKEVEPPCHIWGFWWNCPLIIGEYYTTLESLTPDHDHELSIKMASFHENSWSWSHISQTWSCNSRSWSNSWSWCEIYTHLCSQCVSW